MGTLPRLETFADLEDVLATVTDYEKEQGYRYTGKTFDLSRMAALLERLGRPDRAGTLVHVAGTKGKGSTSATTSALLRATGASPVGLYTSPHLVHLRERIRIAGHPAPDESWLAAAREVIPHALALPARPTFFEITTAIGLCVFRAEGCLASVLEVGLGGRLDATNAVTSERLAASVVTQIGLDHTQLLGCTPGEIAAEKAAIARPGVPLLVGPLEPEALAAVERVASRSPIERIGREIRVEVERVSLDGTRFSVETPRARYRALETPLVGRHQAENAALAIAATEHAWLGPLRALDDAPDPRALEDDVRRGLARVRWRGRFDLVRHRSGAVLIDAAHDPTSAKRLVETLHEAIPEARPTLLLAIARDKEIDLFVDAIAPHVAEAVTVRARTKRAADPAELRQKLEARGVRTAAHEGSSAEALALAQKTGRLVLATGSVYLAGELLAALGEDPG